MTLVGLNTGLSAWLYFNGLVSGEESGALEIAQVLVLLVTALIFTAAILRVSSRSERLLGAGLFLLSLSFIFRELEVQDYDLPPLLIFLGSGMGRNIWIGGLWIAVGLAWTIDWQAFFPAGRRWLLSPAGVLAVLAGGCLLSSIPFDKEWFDLPAATALFWEEIQEMNGYLLLFLSAFALLIPTLRSARQTQP